MKRFLLTAAAAATGALVVEIIVEVARQIAYKKAEAEIMCDWPDEDEDDCDGEGEDDSDDPAIRRMAEHYATEEAEPFEERFKEYGPRNDTGIRLNNAADVLAEIEKEYSESEMDNFDEKNLESLRRPLSDGKAVVAFCNGECDRDG